jgi:hypothetical protein
MSPTSGQTHGIGGAVTGQAARLMLVAAVNLALIVTAAVLAVASGGGLPDVSLSTFALGLLPVSAAFGLVLACRRLDFSLPVMLAIALTMQARPHPLTSSPILPMLTIIALAAGVAFAHALVTWYGRISSALWTGLAALALFIVLNALEKGPEALRSTAGPWAWPAATAASLGVLLAAAIVLGATHLVNLPSLPPILRAGSRGLAPLAVAWMAAGVAVALAARSDALGLAPREFPSVYPVILASGALGGAYVLRGRWGAAEAVGLTVLGHLSWNFAAAANLGSPLADALLPALAPPAAVLLYLAGDWMIRQRTGESAPTGLAA